MIVDKEFLEAEIASFERNVEEARAFITQAQGAIGAYRMLIDRLETPDVETPPEQ